MVASALLFPALFPTLATGVLATTSVPIMLLLAATLGSRGPDLGLLAVGTYSVLWVLGLAVWAGMLRTTPPKLYGVASASLLTVGGAVVAYLGREFGTPTEGFNWSARGGMGPLMGGLSLLESGAGTGTAWAFLGLFLLVTVSGAAVRWGRGRGSPLAA
jgi:hypothetical protein